MIAAIVARSRNGVIGVKNDLPWDLPDDRIYFREMTRGKPVIMGRKTADSIIGRLGHGLPNRENIVITRGESYHPDGFTVVHSVEEAVAGTDADKFIIGGEQIYQLALPYCDRLYVTEVDVTIDGDTYFPDLDPTMWKEVSREPHQKDDKNEYNYDFVIFDRIT